jgi:hypothetical protein
MPGMNSPYDEPPQRPRKNRNVSPPANENPPPSNDVKDERTGTFMDPDLPYCPTGWKEEARGMTTEEAESVIFFSSDLEWFVDTIGQNVCLYTEENATIDNLYFIMSLRIG